MPEEGNPFYPDQPVHPRAFAGRQQELAQLVLALRGVRPGRPACAFIRGDRGLGKTSLVHYIRHIAQGSFLSKPFLTAYCPLGGCRTLETVCSYIATELIEEIAEQDTLARVKKGFADLIDEVSVNLFMVNVRFKPQRVPELPGKFHLLLEGLWSMVSERYGGIMIMLDEIGGAPLSELAPLLKSLHEQIAAETHPERQVPLFIVVAGLDEQYDVLTKAHPSLSRIFHQVILPHMSREECHEVLNKALRGSNVMMQDIVVGSIADLSSGFPAIVQLLGYWAYAMDIDGKIDYNDFMSSIRGSDRHLGAMNDMERRYFSKMYLKDVQSNTYRKILHRVASQEGHCSASDIRAITPNASTYIARLKKRHILKQDNGKRGQYVLVNKMFGVWLELKAMRRVKREQTRAMTPGR